MARLKARGGEVGLREFLLEEVLYLRDTYSARLPEAWDVYSRQVDRLVGRDSFRLRRYELPDDHALRRIGRPGDSLVLTEDDHLRRSS